MGRAELLPLTIGKLPPRKPIVLGGMSVGLSNGVLAGTVAKEEAVGTIGGVGLGFRRPDLKGGLLTKNLHGLKDEIRIAKEISPDGIVGVNLLRAITHYPEHVVAALEAGADFIVTGAGLPLDLPDIARDYPNVALIPIVSSFRATRLITEQWIRRHKRLPDAIVIEEPATAGGHLGISSSQTIHNVNNPDLLLINSIPESKRWIEDQEDKWRKIDGLEVHPIPLIAAGGIWDRDDIDRMVDLGARGFQFGTRFICTEESGASEEFMQSYLDAEQGDVVYTASPVGYPGRVVETDFSRYVNSDERNNPDNVKKEQDEYRCPAKCLEVCSYRESKGAKDYCIIQALDSAKKGDVDHGIVFAGTNVYRAKKQGVVPARKILEELTAS